MALIGKLETELEFKSPADKVYKMIRAQNHHIPNAASDHIHSVEVHEGDWEAHGSVKFWKYSVEGKVETLKEKIEVNDENKTVTLIALEGDCLKQYKNYKITFQVTPKSVGGSVKITLDYEKLNENIQDPNKYLDLLVKVVKNIDAHLLKA